MVELADVTINGDLFMLSAYERSAEYPSPAKPGRLSLSTFNLGLGWTEEEQIPPGQGGGGWSGSQVHAVHGGSGLEPWPAILAFSDTLATAPLKTQRTIGVLANGRVFLNIDRRLYETVAITTGAWAAMTLQSSLAVGVPITDMGYHRDDVLICSGGANDILRWNTSAGAIGTWRAGERGRICQGVGGSLLYADGTANGQERFWLGMTANAGTAVTRQMWVDAPILRMGIFNGQAIIATTLSLLRLTGFPITNVVAADVQWSGQPEPLFGHSSGVSASSGDFSFIQAHLGKLYTWLAGSVIEYDPSRDGDVWRRTGPEGVACYGVVAGDYLVVCIETPAGRSQVWGFDGQGWWLIADALASTTTHVWPVALYGAGGYDVMWFRHNSTTGYNLARLDPKPGLSSYASSGTWTSPLLIAGSADNTKAWRKVAAYFAWPEPPGSSSSVDNVTITLEYSIDAGESWTTADSESVAIGNEHSLIATLTPPPTSRLLQLRVSWDSVLDWAPILTRLVVDYATIDTSPKRRVWKLKVAARDKQVRRDSGVLALDGRQQIDALWEAWRDETTITFRDVDYDEHPTALTVRVLDIAEAAPKPSDSGLWGDGTVTLALGEV